MNKEEQTTADHKVENAREAKTIRILMIVFAALVAACMVLAMR